MALVTTSIAEGRRYAGRSAEERRRDRRERLIAAGTEFFGGLGYRGTSVLGLCARAGMAHRYLYEEYGGLEGLLAAVYAQLSGQIIAAVARAAVEAPHDEAGNPTLAGLRAFAREAAADRLRMRICAVETMAVSPLVEAHRRAGCHAYARMMMGINLSTDPDDHRRAIEEEAAQMVAGAAPPADDIKLWAVAMVGAINEMMIEWSSRQRPPAMEAILEEMVIMARGLQLAHIERARKARRNT